jgi:glycosyltransferase involved in cell wall biosynthesis
MLTMAAVEAADALGIPVVHVATDFLPVCRRATLIRGSGENCETGESIKECASCFLSRRLTGRLTVQLMNTLPTNTVTSLAGRGLNADGINPLRLVRPYWRQVDLMSRRLALLQPLREKVRVVFAPTRFTADSFIANGFPQDRVHIEPFGVEPDNALSRVSHEAADHVRFLAIARFQPYKGLHLLVEAFNRLEQPRGATLTIYGDSHGYDEYARQLRAAAAGNERIRFEGIVSPTELADVFAKADTFVLPSTWHENSPLIVLDALQSGTPLIASDIGGVRDLVHHDENGWLFPMGDADALHGLIRQAIEKPSRLHALRGRSDLQTIDGYSQRLLALSGQQVSMARQAVSGIQGVTDH